MICEHLQSLEKALVAAGFRETFRGQPWGQNCREWVYFDCVLSRPEIRERLHLHSCVADHEHRGTHDGSEAGFVCTIHHDAVMGSHPKAARQGSPIFAG